MQFKLGQHSVRFFINPDNDGWKVLQQIGLEDAWDDPVQIGENYNDRRKAKNAINRQLKELRADPYYAGG